jgi:nicotinamide mononucleotide transporter
VAAFCAWLAAHGSSCLEFSAVLFGIAGVWLSVRQNVWNWPVGIVNVSLYFVLFHRSGLYSDQGLQVVYFALSVYGWYEWLYGGKNKTPLQVSSVPRRQWSALLVVGVLLWAAMGFITSRLPGAAVPYIDAGLVSTSLLAQWMLTRKLIETWILWIVADLVYVCLFISRGLYLTAVNYGVYLVLAVLGYIAWKRSRLLRTT